MHSLAAWIFFASFMGISLPSPQESFAKEVELFDQFERSSENYNQKILDIQPGDTIKCGGQTYRVRRRLGSGETTQIFDIGDNLALRVPKASGSYSERSSYLDFIKAFQNGNMRLQNYQVPTVEFYKDLSVSGRCLVVSKYTPRFSLRALLKYRLKGESIGMSGPYGEPIPHEELELAFHLLGDFLKTTWKLESVSDLHLSNIVFTTEGWIAADYSGRVDQAFSARSKRSIVQAWKDNLTAPEIYAGLEAIIFTERERRWDDNSLFLSDFQHRDRIRQQCPYLNQAYFMRLRPEELVLQSWEVLRRVPRVWFIEKLLADGGDAYFMKLPVNFRNLLKAHLSGTGQNEDRELARHLSGLLSQNLQCSELAIRSTDPQPL
ncbi:MAG: hypothetical protein K2X47_10865 [Bdellovibrionales bacterium]|nr:hypothetical protein [Bdellovibrionales bacterium]